MFISQDIIDSYKPNKPNYRFIKKCIKHNRQYLKKTMPETCKKQNKYFMVIGRTKLCALCSYNYRVEWCEQAVDAWKYRNYLLQQEYEAKIIHTSYKNMWWEDLWELG